MDLTATYEDDNQGEAAVASYKPRFLHLPPTKKRGRPLENWELDLLQTHFGISLSFGWPSALKSFKDSGKKNRRKKRKRGSDVWDDDDMQGGDGVVNGQGGDGSGGPPGDGRRCETRKVAYRSHLKIFHKGPPVAMASMELSRIVGEVTSEFIISLVDILVLK